MSDDLALLAARAVIGVDAAIVGARTLLRGAARRELSRSLLQYVWLLDLAAFAVLWWHPLPVPLPAWYAAVRVAGLAAMLMSTALLLWAYASLGRYWDGLISVRDDHRVVEAGPFALVRHPVYLAFILGVAGGAALLADLAGAGAALASAALMYLRARAEERFLEERLGDAYRDYRRRVPMFVPLPRR